MDRNFEESDIGKLFVRTIKDDHEKFILGKSYRLKSIELFASDCYGIFTKNDWSKEIPILGNPENFEPDNNHRSPKSSLPDTCPYDPYGKRTHTALMEEHLFREKHGKYNNFSKNHGEFANSVLRGFIGPERTDLAKEEPIKKAPNRLLQYNPNNQLSTEDLGAIIQFIENRIIELEKERFVNGNGS